MWSPKRELIRFARQLLPKDRFNKQDLIKATERVFGGFGSAILQEHEHKAVDNTEDIAHQRNAMALIDGHYPLSMTDCEVCGISGSCGPNCPAKGSVECSLDDDNEEAPDVPS